MIVKETKIKGCYLLQPEILKDKRGYFMESFNLKKFYEATGADVVFVQDNEALSSKGVLRGLHYQTGKFSQAKLVRVIKGCVMDVAVDLRPNSPTYGEHVKIELSEENKMQLYIPKGFAHGYLTLEDDTIFSYKCDNFYNKDSERGIIFNDSDLNINWNYSENNLIISEKDSVLPTFNKAAL